MVTYQTLPQFQIVTSYGGSNYTFTNEEFLGGRITRLENGFDTASLYMYDAQSENWKAKTGIEVANLNTVIIRMKDASEGTWTTPFSGILRFINPMMSSEGELLELQCDGIGYALAEMLVAREFGAQTDKPLIDRVGEIITDTEIGIIPKYVNEILANGASGHDYTAISDAGNGAINYVHYPFKPCDKAINDLLDIEQGIRGANAGLHWIVLPTRAFYCTQIGSHSAAAANAGWTTYYGGSKANSTLVQGIDFEEYRFQQLQREANYILYAGAFRKPGSGDFWTENQSGLWGNEYWPLSGEDCTLGDDDVTFKIGKFSLKAVGDTVGGEPNFFYPSAHNAAWDLTKCGGQHNIPTVSFYMMLNANCQHDSYDDARIIFFNDRGGGLYETVVTWLGDQLSVHESDGTHPWVGVQLPIGPNWRNAQMPVGSTPRGWIASHINVAFDWSAVDCVLFYFKSNPGEKGTCRLDGLAINGTVIRAAKDSTIGAANPAKMKLITDDVAKDDTLSATDDTGVLGRLAKAELYRCKNTPIVGFVKTPCIKNALPGQLFYIKAKKKADNNFNIDADMRCTKLVHDFSIQGTWTTLYLTDDDRNAITRPSFDSLNQVLKAARPEFQDRQASSIKTQQIDITQAILEQSY